MVLSHGNVAANVADLVRLAPMGPPDVFLSLLPLSHMFEQTVAIMMEKEFGHKVDIAMVGFPVINSKLPTAFEMYEQAKLMGKGTEMKKVLFRTIHKDRLHVLDRTIREMLIKEVGLDPVAFEAGLASGRPAAA